jgi:hypothetical protein
MFGLLTISLSPWHSGMHGLFGSYDAVALSGLDDAQHNARRHPTSTAAAAGVAPSSQRSRANEPASGQARRLRECRDCRR